MRACVRAYFDNSLIIFKIHLLFICPSVHVAIIIHIFQFPSLRVLPLDVCEAFFPTFRSSFSIFYFRKYRAVELPLVMKMNNFPVKLSSSNLNFHLQTSTFIFKPQHSSSNLNIHLQTSTFIFKPQHSSSNLNPFQKFQLFSEGLPSKLQTFTTKASFH